MSSKPVDLATCGPLIRLTDAADYLRRFYPRMDRILAAPLFSSLIWFKGDILKTYYVRESELPMAVLKTREWFAEKPKRTARELIG